MGYNPISPASQPRLRIVWDLHVDADEFADNAHCSTRQPMQVWRDDKGRWSVSVLPAQQVEPSPKE
jgi:hypothetical protein